MLKVKGFMFLRCRALGVIGIWTFGALGGGLGGGGGGGEGGGVGGEGMVFWLWGFRGLRVWALVFFVCSIDQLNAAV